MTRSIKEISQEYQQQAAIAGDTQYKVAVLQSDLRRMQRKMRELNREAQDAQANNTQEGSDVGSEEATKSSTGNE